MKTELQCFASALADSLLEEARKLEDEYRHWRNLTPEYRSDELTQAKVLRTVADRVQKAAGLA